MRRLNGGVIGRPNKPNVRTAPGIWISREQYVNNIYGQWPVYYPGYDLTTWMNAQTLYDDIKVTPGPTSSFRNIVVGDGGYKAFIVTLSSDVIYSYTMSDPNNLATLTRDPVSLSVTSKEGYPTGIYCVDGYNLYVIGSTSDRIHLYTMWNYWDLSTASWNSSSQSFATLPGGEVRSLTFSSDASKLFILTYSPDRVYQFSLPNPGDITTVINDNVNFTFNSTQKISDAYQLAFNNDGTKLFVLGRTYGAIAEYTLSIPYNLLGMQYSGRYAQVNTLSGESDPYGFAFSGDGSRIFVQYTTRTTQIKVGSSPFTLQENPGYAGRFNSTAQVTNPRAISFSLDGYNMYLVDSSDRRVYQYYLSTPWDVTTASYTGASYYFVYEFTNPTGILWKPDGTKFWLHDTSDWSQYSCWSPWNVGTASLEFSYIEPNGAYCSFFDSNGLNLYIGQTTNFRVSHYSLAIPYDISTATLVNTVELKTMSYLSQDNTAKGLWFSNDGGKMFVMGQTSGRIYQYNLDIAWDVTTATWSNEVNYFIGYISPGSNSTSLYFKPDGTKFFVSTTSSPAGVLQYFTGP